jgi:hypothetical protein
MPKTKFSDIPIGAFVIGYAGWRGIKVDFNLVYYSKNCVYDVSWMDENEYEWLPECDSWDWEPDPQYREPTQADVGKLVEVRDSNDTGWSKNELIAVLPHGIRYRFLTRHNENFMPWKQARI